MTWQPIPVVGGAFTDDARPFACQDTVNWLPVRAERPGARADWMLRGRPGLVHVVTPQAAPVRGAHDAEGKFFSVVGNKVYRINLDATATEVGTLPGVARVSIAHNQITGGNEVVFANGDAGYLYNTATNTFGKITDSGFPGARVVGFVDGYIVFVEPQGRFWGWSDLAAGGSYNTLDRSEAESQPDKIVTLIVSHREVLVLGQRTGEFFRNTGATTGTFQRIDGTEMEVGCAAPFAVGRLDNSAFWLGHDGIVYRLNGYQPVRISTDPIEQVIAKLDFAKAFATVWEDRSHKVFLLTFQDGQTFGYDVSSGEWTRWESYGLARWRLNTLTRWNGDWYGGDYSNGKIYRLDWEVMSEDGAPLVSRRRTAVAHAEGNRIVVAAAKLVFDVGRSGVGNADHFCSVRYSDDGGHNFSDARVLSIGAAGAYRQQVEMRRLGQTMQRVWDIEVASPAKRDLIAASWMPEVCQA
ncbi:packaged DNA stabilization protein [Lysobacter sp. Root667]|uniref:packaged DNA stabilization protein n=1 Tax=Lysobacter sp. Root667 TaxID=1736581 RepID=UPI000A7396E7|nr:packaged DNA stabilization protein [Lysobacter sp. Root667]